MTSSSFVELLKTNISSILCLLFLIITFLQSGIDKVTDWKGNVSFITDHFKSSPLKGQVPLLLSVVLVMEIIAGVLMLVGIFNILTTGSKELALNGAILSAITLLFLLIGQRLAKDYQGAMSLAVYFLVNIITIDLLNQF